jgi:protein-disulfide isomerase
MSISRARRWLATASVLACTAGLAAEQDSAASPTVQALSPAARAEYGKVLEDEFCGCGAPHSLGQCLKTHSECRHSRRVANLAALEAGRGVTASEIGVELARYEQGFRDPRHKFALDDRQCTGKPQVGVTLAEFSDFECPHCALTRPVLEKFASDNASRVRLCWLSFPLTQHPNAMPAAQAVLLARDKGKFWAVHDALFENQRRLSPEVIQGILQTAGVSAADWKKAQSTSGYREQAETQRAAGVAAGVDATPTVFVNGRKLDLPLTPEVLSLVVDDELDWQRTQGTWTTATR